MNTSYQKLVVVDILQETPDTKSFVLRPEETERIVYKPGQFLTLVFPGSGEEERRSYSISSSEFLNEPLTITVKRIDNGAISRYLFDVCDIGSPLLTIGASGLFILPDEVATFDTLFFFAAGSGITPVISLIKSALHQHRGPAIRLMYSNHSPETTIFLQELHALERLFPDRLKVEYYFSNAKNLLRARLSKNRVAEIMTASAPPNREKTLCFLCGPHSYMQMIAITLLTEGVPASNIRKEIFDTVKPVVRAIPSDQDPHVVSVRYRQQEVQFTVQYPDTILATAKRSGIFLPYSCEAGKCGTCAATCLKGDVWMSSNEVLSDREINKGRVLTCTGYPVGGDVVLAFD